MRYLLCVLGVVLLQSVSVATPEGAVGVTAPPKGAREWPLNVPLLRQGGDTVETALVVGTLPFSETGTTTGYTNDYDAVCPYTGSTAPDVVYEYSPAADERISVDLCGSNYDTKLYVMNSALSVIACNDDYYFSEPCGMYVSAYENIALEAGETYYIVVDGYGTEHGEYVIEIGQYEPCVVGPGPNSRFENEPPLEDGYVDLWNGGCNSPGTPLQDLDQFPSFQEIWFFGTSGWYLFDGLDYRDTDWFTATIGPSGELDVMFVAERRTNLLQLGPPNCDDFEILQGVTADPCEPVTLHIEGPSYSVIWLWVGPASVTPPEDFEGHEFHYSLHLSGWPGVAELSFVGADWAPGCPSLPVGWREASVDLSGFNDDYQAPAECFSNPTPGPDAIFEVYMVAGENLNFDNEYWLPPGARLVRTPEDTVVCYLVNDLRLGEGSCEGAMAVVGHEWATLAATETGYHYLVMDFTGGSPDHTARMYTWNEAGGPPTAPAHDTCAGAVEVVGYGLFDYADDLATARNQYDLFGEFGIGGTMGDVVYRVSLVVGDHFEVVMSGVGWEEALYLVGDCADPVASCVAAGVAQGPDSVRLDYTAGETGDYWLICDSYGIGPRPFTLTGILSSATTAVDPVPSQVMLDAAVPNPFNPQTSVRYALPKAGPVSLRVYDVRGRLVRFLLTTVQDAGVHELSWDGRDDQGMELPSGTYILGIEVGGIAKSVLVSLIR